MTCDCPGHRMSGVRHAGACCETPHVGAGSECAPLRPEAIAALGGEAAIEKMQQLATAKVREPQYPLFAIGGAYGAGKDAYADFLERLYGFKRTFFSEPLHEALLKLNPWVRLDKRVYALEGWTYEPGEFLSYAELDYQVGYVTAKEQRDVRERYLQGLGTNVVREMIDPEAWVRMAEKKILELRQQGPVVITGLRYPNELAMIRRLGGLTIYVSRPRPVTVEVLTEAIDAALEPTASSPEKHSSETSLVATDFDAVIENDSDLAHLKRAADWTMKAHRGGAKHFLIKASQFLGAKP